MKYIDLFAGVGGFRYGIEKVTNWNCVWSNEWDPYASAVYRRHYGECDETDIKLIRAYNIPDHDILCAGFPCQAFSIAGKRGGFEDTRGTLFFEIARIVRKKQPRILFLENVKGLLSHQSGRTFNVILNTLDELGYDCQWQMLNSKDFGVPQNRERVYIVANLRTEPRPKIFPITESHRLYPREITKNVSDAQRIYDSTGIAKTLKGLGGGLGAKTGLYTVPMQWRRTEKGRAARRESFKTGRDYTPFNHGYRELVPVERDHVGTITSQAIAKDSLLGEIGKTVRVRRLTPVECERLQSFPDGWTEIGVKPCDGSCKKELNGGFDLSRCGGHEIKISDTQRYKMMGNAVTTNVVSAIAERLYAHFQ